MRFIWVLAFSFFSAAAQAKEIPLSPQFVVDRILTEGRRARSIELDALDAYTAYYDVFSAYDLAFTGRGTYENSRIQQLSGGGNLQDRTSIYTVGISKRIPTGTTIGLGFTRTMQNSVFRATTTSLRPSYVVYDYGEVTLTQDLLGNFFGIAERKNNQAARDLLASSDLAKKEAQEALVLDALKLFWDTYVARESLREAIAQREKYEALVKEVQNKSRLGFSAPGDLPKARAEYGAQVRNVKASSFTYLSSLDALLTAMRMEDADRDVRFEVKEELPPLPTMLMPKVEDLRQVKVYRTAFESLDLAKRATELSVNWPELKLIGSAGATGLESTSSRAFSSMTKADRSRYLVGLEMNYKFFSDGNKASLNRTMVGAERAFNTYLLSKETQRQDLSTVMESVRYTYAAALSSIDELKEWENAVKAQESSYRQGRQDFSQLIQDYNRFFQAKSQRIRAIGNYHIALHAYAAAVDELVR
jgi:outer membrane protein TolC